MKKEFKTRDHGTYTKEMFNTVSKLPKMHGAIRAWSLMDPGQTSIRSNVIALEIEANKQYRSGSKNIILNLFINSGGGRVSTVVVFTKFMHRLQSLGIKFNCYVAQAGSGAFTILQVCDKRIGVTGGEGLFIHQASGNGVAISNAITDYARIKVETRKRLPLIPTILNMRVRYGYDGKHLSNKEALELKLLDTII